MDTESKIISLYETKVDNSSLGDKRKALVKKELRERYEKMRYEVGEAIGVVAAQSISEPATQTTLRSYHRVGGTGLHTTKGLPRILELFDARKIPKTPSMRIYLDDEHNSPEEAKRIASEIKESKLFQVTDEDSLDLVNMTVEVTLDKKAMADLSVEVDDVVKAVKKSMKNVKVEPAEGAVVLTPKKKDFTIRDLQAVRMRARIIHLKGIKGISQGVIEEDDGEWVIITLGSNLKRAMKIKGVDPSRTTSNNIHEIAELLGIEAARAALVSEVTDTLREQGVNTDVRHLLLISDAMTYLGEINAIGRYGLAGSKSSVLSRANFEETVKHLTGAAILGDVEPLNGIVENIIVGKLALVGTGMVDVAMKPSGDVKLEVPKKKEMPKMASEPEMEPVKEEKPEEAAPEAPAEEEKPAEEAKEEPKAKEKA